MNLLMVPTNNLAASLAMIGLVLKASAWLMMMKWYHNLRRVLQNAERSHHDLVTDELGQEVLHDRSRRHHFRWLNLPLEYCLVTLVIHKTKVFA